MDRHVSYTDIKPDASTFAVNPDAPVESGTSFKHHLYEPHHEAQPHKKQRLSGETVPIESLPVELTVKILAALPAREIVQLRSVSKRFRSLIDNNAEAIVLSGVLYNQSRIRAEIEHLGNVANLSLEDAIRRCYQYFGPQKSHAVRTSFRRLVARWLEAQFPLRRDHLDSLVHAEVLVECVYTIVEKGGDLSHRALKRLDQSAGPMVARGYDHQAAQSWITALLRFNAVEAPIAATQKRAQTLGDFSARNVEYMGIDAEFNDAPCRARAEIFSESALWLGIPSIEVVCLAYYRANRVSTVGMLIKAMKEPESSMVCLKRAAALEDIYFW